MWKKLILLLVLIFCTAAFSNKNFTVEQCISSSNSAKKIESSFEDITWDRFMLTANALTHELEHFIKPRIQNIVSDSNISEACSKSIDMYIEGVRNWEPWAIQMADATAKIPSGLLSGTKTDFGSFDQCLEVRAKTKQVSESFKGKFCMVGIQTPLVASLKTTNPTGKSYLDAYGVPPDWILSIILKQDNLLKSAGIWMGICMPSVCTESDVHKFFTSASKPWASKVSVSDCQTDEPKAWPKLSMISKYVLLLLVGICILGTTLDMLDKNSEKEISTVKKLLKCFSLYSNTEKLFQINDADRTPFNCLNGIRFFLSFFIVTEHAAFLNDRWAEMKYSSFYSGPETLNSINGLYFENGFIFIENFHMMSGLLLAFTTLKQLAKYKRIDFIDFVVQKYFRILPPLILAMLLLFVLPLLNSGPVWNSTWEFELEKCQQHGWLNFFFMQNSLHLLQVCMVQSWFLGSLMQTQIVALFALFLIYRYPKIGISVTVLIISACFLIDYKTMMFYKYPMLTFESTKDYETMKHFVSKVYFRPFNHFISVVIGMAVAIIYLKYKDREFPQMFYKVGWILAFVISHLILLGLYMRNPSVRTVAVFFTFRNLIWSSTFAWLVYCCATGHGGLLNRITSSDVFIPLSRISYCIFILHPLVLLYRFALLKDRMSITIFSHIYEGCAAFLITSIFSIIAFIAVEMPFINIYNTFFKRKPLPPLEKQKEIYCSNGKHLSEKNKTS